MSTQSHPLHPATVHFPIALLFLAYALDLLQLAPASFIAALAKLPLLDRVVIGVNGLNSTTIPCYGHHILTLALISAIPAVLTGIYELLGMIQRYDLLGKFSRSANKSEVLAKMPTRLKKAFLHAVSMDAVVIASAYSLYDRRQNDDFLLSQSSVLLSAFLAIFLAGGSWLGGQLVFDHGVGVSTSSATKKAE